MKVKFNLNIHRYLIIILVLLTTIGVGQIPQGINYQAVLRNGTGQVLQNQAATIQFIIRKTSASGISIYQESHLDTTNEFGLVNLQIGQGLPSLGTFNSISWGTDTYFLHVLADIGSGFVSLGTTQFISVPYAMVADTVLHGGGGGTGTVISISTGTGLTGGPITTSGTISAQNTSPIWNAEQIQNIGVSITTPTTGQALVYDGASWSPGNVNSIYIINSGNYSTTFPGTDKIVNIQGTVNLFSTYNNLNNDNLFISGGTINGGGNSIAFGNNSVISNVNFINVSITGTNIQFVNCHFTGVSDLPFRCSLNGCQIASSSLTTMNIVGYINNSILTNTTIPRMEKICNSEIENCTLGNTTNFAQSVVGNKFINSLLYLSGTFSGNICEDTRIRGYCLSSSTINITGNTFTNFSLATNVIEIDVVGSSIFSTIISENNFLGNSSSPIGEYIRFNGAYAGTRYLTKISNNVAIGGPASSFQFITISTSGQIYHTVNDNDHEYVGGGSSVLGVSSTSYITVRNNVAH